MSSTIVEASMARLTDDELARGLAVAHLFLRKSDRDTRRAMEEPHGRKIASDEISWHYYLADWDMESIYQTISVILSLPSVRSVYVGITESPIWRWQLCDRHHNDDFRAHKYNGYSRMYIITCERTEPIIAMEEMTVEFAKASRWSDKVRNSSRYVSGPVNAQSVMFLYCCTMETDDCA